MGGVQVTFSICLALVARSFVQPCFVPDPSSCRHSEKIVNAAKLTGNEYKHHDKCIEC